MFHFITYTFFWLLGFFTCCRQRFVCRFKRTTSASRIRKRLKIAVKVNRRNTTMTSYLIRV